MENIDWNRDLKVESWVCIHLAEGWPKLHETLDSIPSTKQIKYSGYTEIQELQR